MDIYLYLLAMVAIVMFLAFYFARRDARKGKELEDAKRENEIREELEDYKHPNGVDDAIDRMSKW